MADIPALESRESIPAQTERLHTRQFTLALFGAFSSGKSSFANALCGRKVLPSSPTPTTATINK
ncbi:dynamin family protein [Bacillus licheniformis]|nr:dynamin family protein [Bacillus licheniformis]